MGKKDASEGPAAVAAIIEPRDIAVEAESSYRAYAQMTISDRALPDARDGLKPVQRRILQAMRDQGLGSDRPRQKCATIVGATLGRYHPHGDSAVYETLVRLGQSWVMALPLIDPQGNFGSQDGDPAAAYRYTEARLTPAADVMLEDLGFDVVERGPTYDDRHLEALVLPARLPYLLLNGGKGIAVGLSTSIPPHNLHELAGAIALLCDDPGADDGAVGACVLGPDFPTGGEMIVGEGLKEAYRTGAGRVTVRASVHTERLSSGARALVVSEMPYGVDKGPAVDRLARLVRQAREGDRPNLAWGEGVAAIRDESSDVVRVVIEMKRGVAPETVLEGLWAASDFSVTVPIHLLALVGDAPKQLTLRSALEVFIAHRLVVVKRRAESQVSAARARLHVVDGLVAALADMDEVVRIIRAASSPAVARQKLIARLRVDESQGDAILALRLSQLTRLDADTLARERATLATFIKKLDALIASPRAMRGVVRAEVVEDAARFGVPRRTRIYGGGGNPAVAAATVIRSNLRVDPRGGVLLSGGSHPDSRVGQADAAVPLWLFSSAGRYGRSTGETLEDLLPDERVLLCWRGALPPDGDVVAWYENGMVKRLAVGDLRERDGWATFANLAPGDRMVGIDISVSADALAWAASRGGQGILVPVEGLPRSGRQARGVAGIRLKAGDLVVSAGVYTGTEDVLVRVVGGEPLRGLGFALSTWPRQGRGGQGVRLVRTGGDPLQAVLVGDESSWWWRDGRGVVGGAPLVAEGSRGGALRTPVDALSPAPGQPNARPVSIAGSVALEILWREWEK